MNTVKLAKAADKFCKQNVESHPDIWWCYGNSDESRILFYISNWNKENQKPVWKMNSDGIVSIICENVPFGSYACYETIEELNICVDKCLVKEIKELNEMGIKTIGCCCGHRRLQGFIQVQRNYVSKMKELGYEQIPVDKNGHGKWCFKPKIQFNITQ